MNNLQLSVLLNAIDKMSAPVRNASKSVRELSAKLRESKNAQRQLAQQNKQHAEAMKQYASTINPLKAKLSSLNNELSAAKQKAASYSQYLKNAKNPTEGFKKEVEKARSAVKKLKQEQVAASNKLQQAKLALSQAGISAEKLAKNQLNLQKNTKAATDQIKHQEEALKKLNTKQAAYSRYRGQVEKLKDISGKAQIIGAQSMAAGATITAPIAAVTKDFMTFEDAMIGVARQVDGLKDKSGNFTQEFDQWKIKIHDLSKELPLTTVQIANMIESAARMNIAKDELEDFVRLNTQMAIAFDAKNPDELVESFGKVSKNFNLTQKQTKELADTINYLDDNAISKGTGIIGYMNRVAGIAAIAKITDKNMAALGSTLQTLGAEEEDSATAVTTIFTRLGVAGNHKEVDGALKKLKLNPQKIAKGMAKDAQSTLMLIVNKIKGLDDDAKSDVMKGLVGIPHIKTISKLVANTEEWRRQIELANSEAAKGSMGREFDTRMKALSASTQIFTNRLFNLKTTIGGTLAPTLHNILDKLGSVVDKFKAWIETNPELARKILLVASALGTTLTAFGALSLALSFVLYPMARVALGFGKLTGLNTLLAKSFNYTTKAAIASNKNLLSFRGWSNIFSSAQTTLTGLLGKITKLNTLKVLLGVLKAWTMPVRMIFIGLSSSISFLLSPIGVVVAAVVGAGIYIYKNWEKVKSFFSGFLSGLQSGLQPVIDKFKPFVGWIESVFNWFTNLLSPIQSTKEDLDAAASAGKQFGEWVAFGIDLALKPLQLLIDGVKWLIDNLPKISEQNQKAKALKEETMKAAFGNGVLGQTMAAMADIPEYATGGYTGNGGKYQPMGIVHGGEYVMTKEATSRLGIATLNALNYGKQALIAGGLGIGLATAAPIQVDSRPPISARPSISQTMQPMAVNITINAQAGQNERQIAQLVAAELERINRQQQARMRSRMTDRA
ncbi:MAG: phage tail tape measure protein [Haemophilus parahaemolyticus]|uniref:phage tail tape measure protein n=1 Tax=Haemophilus parahaemolyticus TaxID=735 RepID=UPI0026EB813B|nr:phage tail tape measure protein [Haemophilus parahaemolyticus]MBS6008602.1 phage tail tape measure protein [Haemophilus parahaemolyticus]